MIEVTLTTEQCMRAASVGAQRRAVRISQGRSDIHNDGENPFERDIQAAGTELAVAVSTGRPWTGESVWIDPPKVKVPDVGDDIEVRRPRKAGGPLVYDVKRGVPERWYVLVEGVMPTFRIIGSIQGWQALEIGTLRSYPERDVRLVQQADLIPFALRSAA